MSQIYAVELTRWQKTKHWCKTHKREIAAGGIGVLIGAATAVLLTRKPEGVNNQIRQGIAYKSPPTLEVHIEALGDPGNIIQDLDTGSIYASQNQAARELGVSRSRISSHVNGHIPDADGHRLAKLGKAHVSEAA